MTFRVLVDGEEVHSVDEQVTAVTVDTPRGVAARVGISTESAINIVLETVAPGGVMRLDHLEALQRREQQERSKDNESFRVPAFVGGPLLGTQGDHTETARSGGVEASERSATPPDRDLTEGIDASDTEARTSAINSFNSDAGNKADTSLQNEAGVKASQDQQREEEQNTNDNNEQSSFDFAGDNT